MLDRTGKVIGTGAFDAKVPEGDVAPDPGGAQWTWSVDDTPPNAPQSVQHHGRIMVAGLGTARHPVYSWVAPTGDTERVGAWTDMGIVMQRLSFGGCGPDFDGAYVNPDGALVGVARLTPLGCAGGQASARVNTQLITVGSGAHVDLPGCEIRGWFDTTHFVCQAFQDQTDVLHDLTGNTGATLGKGSFLGVLLSS